MSRLTRTGLPNPSHETKFSGANEDREIFIFYVQLTTSRIGNLTRLILALLMCDDHIHTLNMSKIRASMVGCNTSMYAKKNMNASRPSEHPPVRGKKCQNVLGVIIDCKY